MDEVRRRVGGREMFDRMKRRYLDEASRKTGVSIALESSRSSSRWARTSDGTEVADALCRRDRRHGAVETLLSAKADPQITSVPGSAQLFARGLDLYRAPRDKDWTLTDCMSFVVMKERRLDRALTADLHFVQAGFRALLRE